MAKMLVAAATLFGRSNPSYKLSVGGLCFVVCFGAWWMAQAVIDGEPFALAYRFVLAVAGGVYYVALMRIASGQKIFDSE